MSEYRYKPGDKVRVKYPLNDVYSMESGPKPGVKVGVVSDMLRHQGKIVTIKGYRINRYTIQEDKYGRVWVDEMFEPAGGVNFQSLL